MLHGVRATVATETRAPTLSREQRLDAPPKKQPQPARELPNDSRSAWERLEAAWRDVRVVGVPDAELAAAVDQLWARHHDGGFLEDPLSLLRRGPVLSKYFETVVAHRPSDRPIDNPDAACVMCNSNFEDDRRIQWRSLRVATNAYPYALEGPHLLLIAGAHEEQSLRSEHVDDLIRFQWLTQARPFALHYNATANSQFHRHWHATRETTPLERALDSGRAPRRTVLRREGNSVEELGGAYRGVLVSGDHAFVASWVERLIDAWGRDDVVKGTVEVFALPPRNGRFRWGLFPRVAADPSVQLSPWGEVRLGGMQLAGRLTIDSPSNVHPGLESELRRGIEKTVVPLENSEPARETLSRASLVRHFPILR